MNPIFILKYVCTDPSDLQLSLHSLFLSITSHLYLNCNLLVTIQSPLWLRIKYENTAANPSNYIDSCNKLAAPLVLWVG